MINNLPGLCVVLPLLAGLFVLLVPRPSAGRRVFTGAVLAALTVLAGWLVTHVVAEGPLVLRIGGWLAPYGIVLVMDTLAAIMVTLSFFTALGCVLFGFAETPVADEHPLRLPLVLCLMTGINLSFLTGDLFNLFVAFEVMLLSSYALLTLEVGARDSRQALPYLMINLVASALFIAGCGFTYSLLGTLNFAEMIVRADLLAGDFRLTLLAALLAVVFSIKAGAFPLYYWLPGSYPIMPAPMTALFGGLLTKVGVYVLLRVFGTVFPPMPGLQSVFLWVGVITIFTGVLGAVSQYGVQRILSFHIVSQIGYMLLALGLPGPAAVAAVILFLGHNILVKSSLFLVGGTIMRVNGTDTLSGTGNLWRTMPLFGVIFLVQALSLAGLPPFSGFWGKVGIAVAGLGQGEWTAIGLAIAGSILTLMSMLKIWLGAFWKTDETVPVKNDARARLTVAVTALFAAAALWVGIGAETFSRLSSHAAAEVLDRPGYVATVKTANITVYEGKQP